MANPDEIKKDFRQELTDKFVAALEEGRIPWQRPWNEVATPMSAPVNAVSGNQYQGGNRLVLTLTQMDRNYPDSRWVTFNQAKALGGSVAKGEKGTQIEFWREKPFYQRKDVDVKLNGTLVKVFAEKDGQVTLAGGHTAPVSVFDVHHDSKEYGWGQAERRLNTLVAQTHTIFNVQQCQDLKLEPLVPTPESRLPMHERGELLMEGMKADGVRFVEAPNRAFYRSASDTISLPPRDHFKSEALFYGTALHESAHATGNEKRLNRDVGKNEFGSEGYAKEELVAEMTSAFLAAETGIPHDVEDHKSYIQSWAQALKNDKNEIFRAAKLADQAANYMHDKSREVQLEKAHAISNERESFAGIDVQPLPGLSPDSRDAVETPEQAQARESYRAAEIIGKQSGHSDKYLDALLEAQERMADAKEQLALGKIDQEAFDRVVAMYGKPDLSGINGISNFDILKGNFKPSPDSRVYVERGILTIDHNEQKVSFGCAKAMEGASADYGTTTKDLRTAYAIEQKQADARLELDHSEAKDMNAWFDMAKDGQGELVNPQRDYGITTPEPEPEVELGR